MIILSRTKILQNPVQDRSLLKMLQEPIALLYLVLPRSYKILSKILLKILQESYRIIVLCPLRSYKILSKILLKILQEPIG